MNTGTKLLLFTCGTALLCLTGIGLLCHSFLERDLLERYKIAAAGSQQSMQPFGTPAEGMDLPAASVPARLSSEPNLLQRLNRVLFPLLGLSLVLIGLTVHALYARTVKRPLARLREYVSALASGPGLPPDQAPPADAALPEEFAALRQEVDGLAADLADRLRQTDAQQTALQEEHAQLKAILNASTDLMHFKDDQLRYRIANAAHENMFDTSVDQMIGKRPDEVLPRIFAEQTRITDEMALRQGRCTLEEYLDGRWFLNTKIRVDNDDGTTLGIVGIIRDITDLKQAQQLELDKARAEAANDAKTDFLATMSHEIRTPMNVMLGMLDLLEETGTSEAQAEYLASLRRSGEHLMHLINDVLDFSKIEAGEVILRRTPFSLRPLLHDVLDAGRVVADEKNLTLTLALHLADDEIRTGDAPRLMQVLMNLVSNAVKFTPAGEVVLHVRAAEGDDTDWLVFSVSDTGVGIPARKLPRIFDAFTQVGSDVNIRAGGTGLGLAISKRLVELMGGDIRISSEEGRGTTVSFRLRLPLQSSGARPRYGGQAASGFSPQRPVRVLLAEDMEDNRALVAGYLSKSPVQLDLAEDGEQALRKTAENDYDLVLMDVRMPGMDGIEATRRIRQREKELGLPPLPIVALTAHAFTEFRNQCLEAGCTAYMTKPISKSELLETIASLARADADLAGTE